MSFPAPRGTNQLPIALGSGPHLPKVAVLLPASFCTSIPAPTQVLPYAHIGSTAHYFTSIAAHENDPPLVSQGKIAQNTPLWPKDPFNLLIFKKPQTQKSAGQVEVTLK